jgi:TonB family protein
MVIMKTLLLATVVACLPICAFAQDKPNQVVVTASPVLGQWVDHMSRRLSETLDYPQPVGPTAFEEGRAVITFRRGADGRPAGMALVHSTGSSRLNRAAIRAVAGLSLDPMPGDIARDQQFRADIIFAQTAEDAVAQQREIRRADRRARLAATTPSKVIALAAGAVLRP